MQVPSFESILVRDDGERNAALDTVMTQLYELAGDDNVSAEEFAVVVPTILRYSRECPFETVRDAFKQLESFLRKDQVHSVSFPESTPIISSFFPRNDFPSLDALPSMQEHLEDTFIRFGRIANLTQLFLLLPEFFVVFSRTLGTIMRDDGPIPVTWRHYLAILAASRYNCTYLIKLHERDFLLQGGDLNWLSYKKEDIPKKIVKLFKINALLAHQPWKISSETFSELMQGSDSWSISELLSALLILNMYHMLSGISFGLGVSPESDLVDPTEHLEEFDFKISDSNLEILREQETQRLFQLLNEYEEVEYGSEGHEFEEEQDDDSDFHESVEGNSLVHPLKELYADVDYIDFFGPENKQHFKSFRLEDFCWEHQAFPLLRHFVDDSGSALDEEFSFIVDFTDHSVNDESVADTSPFRRAIWFYSQRLYGIVSDGYDYGQVNIFLNKDIKIFIKKVCCFPEIVCRNDFEGMGYNFQPREKVHLTLLALEARRRSALLYSLRAMSTLI